MKARDIERAIINSNYARKAHIMSLRTYLAHELDVMLVSKSMYVTEFEIKVSLSDFRADFKKEKHEGFSIRRGGKIRRFFFVCPYGMIPPDLIPDYAGLIYVDENGFIETIKDAPVMRASKLNQADISRIYRSIMYRWIRKETKKYSCEDCKK